MADKNSDDKLHEIMYNLRSKMQIVQLQFDIMKKAVDKCGNIDGSPYIECVGSVKIAHDEIIKFMELNVQLVKLIDDMRNEVCLKKI